MLRTSRYELICPTLLKSRLSARAFYGLPWSERVSPATASTASAYLYCHGSFCWVESCPSFSLASLVISHAYYLLSWRQFFDISFHMPDIDILLLKSWGLIYAFLRQITLGLSIWFSCLISIAAFFADNARRGLKSSRLRYFSFSWWNFSIWCAPAAIKHYRYLPLISDAIWDRRYDARLIYRCWAGLPWWVSLSQQRCGVSSMPAARCDAPYFAILDEPLIETLSLQRDFHATPCRPCSETMRHAS